MTRTGGTATGVVGLSPPIELDSPALSVPRTRPSPKSAGSASLPAAPATLARTTTIWEQQQTRGRQARVPGPAVDGLAELDAREFADATTAPASRSPFEDPLTSPSTESASGHSRASIVSSKAATAHDPSPPTPDNNQQYYQHYYMRRNSTLSTSSLASQSSPTSPGGIASYYAGGSTGGGGSRQRYSIATASSYTHTIGDLSTSSMPLLRYPTRGGDESSSTDANSLVRYDVGGGGGGDASNSSRAHLTGDASSRASYCSTDDASSVHSYPPRARPRAGSTRTTSDSGDAAMHSWTRAFESSTRGATSPVYRRGSADSRVESWPSFVTNSYVHQPIARPVPAYISQLSNYSFPSVSSSAPSAASSSKVPPPRPSTTSDATKSANAAVIVTRAGALRGSANPLAPLRKRLARSLAGAGGHLHTEVQLLLELVDALDHCITLFSSPSASKSTALPSSTSPKSTGAREDDGKTTASEREGSSEQNNNLQSMSAGGGGVGGPARSKTALLDEVRLLVRELVELVPDAQRCLANGQYGPLAFPNTTTARLVQSLERLQPQPAEPVEMSGGKLGPLTTSPSASPSSPRTPSNPPPRPPSLASSSSPPSPFSAGRYARPSVRVSTSSWESRGVGGEDWWPTRLARDCRNLLVEAGLPTGRGSAVWLAAKLSQMGGIADDDDGEEEANRGGRDAERLTEESTDRGDESLADAVHDVLRLRGRSHRQRGDERRESDDRPRDEVRAVDEAADDDDQVELREALAQLQPSSLGMTTIGVDPDLARRDELLEQGKKRWEAYMKKRTMQKEA